MYNTLQKKVVPHNKSRFLTERNMDISDIPKSEIIQKRVELFGTKWIILIIRELLVHEVCRYGELKKNLKGISTKTLTEKLRLLEKEKIIKRKIYPEIPPKVEYSLTPKGKSIQGILWEMKKWHEKWY